MHDRSPGTTAMIERKLKEIAGIDIRPPRKVRLPTYGGTEQMDPERALRRLWNVAYGAYSKVEHETYQAIRQALENNEWNPF
jgi:hypothetical protein